MALGRWAGGRVSAVQLPPLKRAELGKGAELGKRLFKVYGERSGLFRVLLRSEPGKKRNSLLFPSPPPPCPDELENSQAGFWGGWWVFRCRDIRWIHLCFFGKEKKGKLGKICGFLVSEVGDVAPMMCVPPRLRRLVLGWVWGFGGLRCWWVMSSVMPGWGIWCHSRHGSFGTATARRVSVSKGLERAGKRGAEGMLRFIARERNWQSPRDARCRSGVGSDQTHIPPKTRSFSK